MPSVRDNNWDGDSFFSRGVNSQQDPTQLVAGLSRKAMNLVNRGGVWQTRPGYHWMFNLPDGELQGGFLFHPSNDVEYLVFAVDGLIYVSPYPFMEYRHLEGLEFAHDARNVYFEEAEKSVEVQPDESLRLVTPYKVLLVQDGSTPVGYWDGTTARHLLEEKATPIGTVMKWVGDRLWVLRDKQLFACDTNDPISNREGTYFSNAKSFLLDRPGTAMAKVTFNSQAALLVFTDTATHAFRADMRRRADWSDPENQFQRILLENIGCVSHRSPVTMNGLLWWTCQHGLTNFDAALAANATSRFSYQDAEMAHSKGFLPGELNGVAAAVFENYLLVSVPYADPYNTHTWVLDTAPADSKDNPSAPAWNGYWTGTRPVEWVFGQVRDKTRIFQFSKDHDGKNRCWEAFMDDRTDHGCPITWALETRGYTQQTLGEKKFKFADLYLSELLGDVDLGIFWAGTSRGAYKKLMDVSLRANEGTLENDPDVELNMHTDYFSLKKQSRRIRTPDISNADLPATSCNVESARLEAEDIGHQLFIAGSGQVAIRAIRVTMEPVTEDVHGGVDCDTDEIGDDEINAVRFDGAGAADSEELEGLADPDTPEVFEEFYTAEVAFGGETYAVVAVGNSIISQENAARIAECHAWADANEWLEDHVPLHVGDPDAPDSTSASDSGSE